MTDINYNIYSKDELYRLIRFYRRGTGVNAQAREIVREIIRELRSRKNG